MKKIIKISLPMIMLMVLVNLSFSQVSPSSPEYQGMKEQGLIEQPQQVIPVEPVTPIWASETGARDVGLFVPLDGTFTLAMGPNDDLSTGEIALPFDFCFYGTIENHMWINNNGNVSFDGPYGTYSASGFPSSAFYMIAPFWADVDTRSGLGQVWYKITSNRVVVIWDNVGYFSVQGDKRNTFELIFTDGNDPLIGVGNNVAFSYGDMHGLPGALQADQVDSVGFPQLLA